MALTFHEDSELASAQCSQTADRHPLHRMEAGDREEGRVVNYNTQEDSTEATNADMIPYTYKELSTYVCVNK